jgi:outer membrane protein, heavy metal efflux system
MARFHAVVIALCTVLISTQLAAAFETKELTLEQAITLALEKNPELASSSWEVRAREGRVAQAGVLSNPGLEFSIENFSGNKDLRGFDGADYTLAITQLIELGGKRSKRIHAAGIDRDLAEWDYKVKKRDLIAEVTKAFIDVIAEQERSKVADELYQIGEQSLKTVSVRVQAGKVSPIEESRATAELAKTRIDLERSKRVLDAARKRLATVVGSTAPFFDHVTGQLEISVAPPFLDKLEHRIDQNPDVARWSAEIEQRTAALDLERANRIPDPSVSLGVRRFRETETSALVAGISFPLPLFNRNTGAIAEAKSKLQKAGEERKAALLKARVALTEIHLALSSAFAEATALKTSILPGLLATFEAVQEGYRYGKFGYLDLLEAQRSLSESKKQLIESLTAYRKAYADVERLTGSGRAEYGSALRQ